MGAAETLSKEVLRELVTEIQEAKTVDWSARDGAVCPLCNARRCRVTTSSGWVGDVRERFHRCPDCGLRFKSVENS